MLEIAFRLRNVTNVFSLKATDAKSLDRALLQIAVSIGHELLSIRFTNTDLASLWRAYSQNERIQAFKTWLAHKDNQPSVFVVDDLDGLGDEDIIASALPSQAQIILYSARDPTIMESLERHGKAYHIPDMEIDEMASLMNATLQRTGGRVSDFAISEFELEAIAKIVSGHALGACRAITYILNVLSQTSDKPATTFIEAFSGSNWQARKHFLAYKPRLGLSVMETLTTSLDRMRNHKEASMKLLDVMAFLSDNASPLHPRDFFRVEKPWLKELQTALPDYDIFAQGLRDQNEYLLELERVSIGVRPVVPGPLLIHPLWIECIQQRAEHGGRLRWLRQIIVLCHASDMQDSDQYHGSLIPFVRNAALIATRFDIAYRDLCENEDVWYWFRSATDLGDEYIDTAALSTGNNDSIHSTMESLEGDEDTKPPERSSRPQRDDTSQASSPIKETVSPTPHTAVIQNDDTCSHQIALLHEHCKFAATAIASSNPEKLSEEAFETQLQRYLGILRRLKAIEEALKLQTSAQEDMDACIEIYDLLIQMAPAFRNRNPMLVVQLRKRKEGFMGTLRSTS